MQNAVFFYEMDLPVVILDDPFVDLDSFREISCQPVGGLYDGHLYFFFADVFQHLVEDFTLDPSAGGFLNGEHFHQTQSASFGILLEELLLGRQRITGVLLIFGRHPGIADGP
ncbi:MAG: hypothetical protein KGJ13_01775 [Patescibacteria group bacterium]|nr:hypothetical protein [Patescibacteria group bacterium]